MEDIIDFPPLSVPIAPLHPKDIEEQSFFGAVLSDGNPIENNRTIRQDLITKGSSGLLDSLNTRLTAEKDVSTKTAISSLIDDQSVAPDVKQKVLQQYAMSGTVEVNLRNSYLTTIAAKDVAELPSDQRAQDIVVNTLFQREKIKAQEQMYINNYYGGLSGDKVKGFLGAIAEFIPGIHGYSTAKLYDELIMGGKATVWQNVKNAVWGTASTEAEMSKFYQALPLEKKKDFVRHLVEVAKDLPGFEFQNYQHVENILKNPESNVWENIGNVVGVLDAVGIGWMLKNPAKTVKWLKPADNFFSLRVKPRSPLGTTATANPQVASNLAASAIVDETGEIAAGIGATKGEILSWALPKVDAQGLEAVPNLAAKLEKLDASVREGFDVTGFNPALYNVTSTQADVNKIHDFIKEFEAPVYNPGNSTFNPAELNNQLATNKGYSGIATFGKTADYGFTSVEEATEVMRRQQKYLPGTSTMEVVELAPNQHFIQMKWAREMDKLDILLHGDMAISTKFLGFDVSKAARATGNWLFGSYDRLPDWVYGGATKSELTERFLDQKFIQPILTEIAKNKFGREIGDLLIKGGKTRTATGGKVFSYAEVLDSFPKHSVEDVKQIYEGYAIARRIGDYSYNFANRLDRINKAREGMQGIYDATGKLSHYGKVISGDVAKKLSAVFDTDTGKVLKGADTEGVTVVKLNRAIEDNNDLYEYATLGKGQRTGMLPQRTLPYLEGYFPRQYKEFFWVDILKKGLKVNGEKVVDPKEADRFRKAIYSTKTEADARKFKAEYEKAHPGVEVSVRPDRMDHEQAVIDSYTAFSDAFQASKSRGDHIITGANTLAETEDPLVAFVKNVRSTAKRTAWADWRQEFEESFKRQYGEFLHNGQFPRTLSGLINPEHASIEKTKAFKDAVENFKYYSDMVETSELLSDRAWNGLMSGIGDVLDDKSVWASSMFRELSRQGAVPVRALQKAGTVLYIFTNPIRQLAVQSQQLFELGALTPSAIKDMTVTHTGMLLGMAADRLGGVVGDLVREASYISAKWGGYSKDEFELLFKQFRQEGIAQGVDSNMILHGLFNQADEALTASKVSKAGSTAMGIVKAPVKVGKLGFDLGELMNMTGAWLWARKRAINAGVDVNTPEALAQISIEARRITGSMTKTGAMEFQKGVLAIPLQFASVAHKLFLQPFSARNLSAADKAKLFATRAVFYGAYGTGAAAGFEALREKYYDAMPKEGWDVLMGGLMDFSWNNLLEWEFGKGEDLAVAPSLTPVSEYGLPYVDFLWSIFKEPEGFYKNVPLTNIVGRFSQMWYDINAYSTAADISTKEKAELMIDSVLQLSSGYSNYMQAAAIIATGKQVNKFGDDQNLQGSWKTAVGKVLGFQTEGERTQYDASKYLGQRDKHLQSDARLFHNSIERMMRNNGTYDDVNAYIKTQLQLITVIDEADRSTFLDYLAKEDKASFKGRGVSVAMWLDKEIRSKANSDLIMLTKRLSDNGSEPSQNLLKILKAEGVLQ